MSSEDFASLLMVVMWLRYADDIVLKFCRRSGVCSTREIQLVLRDSNTHQLQDLLLSVQDDLTVATEPCRFDFTELKEVHLCAWRSKLIDLYRDVGQFQLLMEDGSYIYLVDFVKDIEARMLRGKSLREIFLREKFKEPEKVVINTNIKIPISHEDEDPDDLNEEQLRTLIQRTQSREEYRLAEEKGIVPQDIVPQKR